ncbi:acetyl-CoA C-acyltransferase [Deltaproteobacteria bacterium TL4]
MASTDNQKTPTEPKAASSAKTAAGKTAAAKKSASAQPQTTAAKATPEATSVVKTVSKTTSSSKTEQDRLPVLIDGVRTPFLRSNGSYSPLMPHDLGKYALTGLLEKTGVDPGLIELVIMGTVVHETSTPNVARESMLAAGIPNTTPAYTVSLACISSNVAAGNICDMIRLGRMRIGIAGGTDTSSDPPIRLSKKLRQGLARLQKAKTVQARLKELSKLSFKDLAPDIPSITEYSTKMSMGDACERMVKRIGGVTREDSDAFAARSHQLAVKAWSDGIFEGEVLRIHVPPKLELVEKDDGPRANTTLESLSKLKPAFDKIFGVLTAGSSSFLTDGASAVLFTSLKQANALNLTPKAVIQDYVYRAGDPMEELLLGPALTIPALLDQNNLSIKDIEVWELHEAFSAQILANLACLKSTEFCKNRLGRSKAFGEIPLEQINIWGGSLSLGHPFGATGGRLLTMATKRLLRSGARYAVVSGCAAGGHGSAILLENPKYL